MEKFLFLDFDGVLHSEYCETHFSKRPLFEHYLAKMPAMRVVISSSWRELYPFQTLREQFTNSVQNSIIGITPLLACGYEAGGRQREIEAFLRAKGLDPAHTAWRALDDLAYLFDEGCPNLILVDPDRGFSDREGQILLNWYQAIALS